MRNSGAYSYGNPLSGLTQIDNYQTTPSVQQDFLDKTYDVAERQQFQWGNYTLLPYAVSDFQPECITLRKNFSASKKAVYYCDIISIDEKKLDNSSRVTVTYNNGKTKVIHFWVMNSKGEAALNFLYEVTGIVRRIPMYSQISGEQCNNLSSLQDNKTQRTFLDKRRDIAEEKYRLEVERAASKTTARQRKKINKQQGIACCPKCGSTSIVANKQGFGIGKAITGAALIGVFGLVGGNINSHKLYVTCLNCKHKWKI